VKSCIVRAASVAVLAVAALVHTSDAEAQPRATSGTDEGGGLEVRVEDPSGAIVPQAVVQVRPSTGGETWETLTFERESFVNPALASGSYDVRVTAPGFAGQTREGVTVGRDSRRLLFRLALDRLAASVVVERDPRSAALDLRGFSTFLSREQIDALPDDPGEMQRVLHEMAPPGAVLRIDGFTGGILPPKTQILSIRIPRIDALAAEDHGGLDAFSAIDIVTRAGSGAWHGGAGVSGRNARLDARNPLTRTKVPEAQTAADATFDGPLQRERISIGLQFRGSRDDQQATIRAVLPGNSLYDRAVTRPTVDLVAESRLIAALGDAQTLRVGFALVQHDSRNDGVGEGNLEQRRFDTASLERAVRLAFGGPVGRRRQLASRLALRWSGTRTTSAVEAPTIDVLDAFTSGGAQATSGERALQLEAASDLDYARGAHALRTGVLVNADRRSINRRSNYAGTYTFSSLDAFEAGTPSLFTRRIGDARLRYTDARLGVYLQDDLRVSRSLLVSYGLRSEWQSLARSLPSVLPRGGFTWSPRRSGSPTVRVSAGVVRDWLPIAVFEQAQLVDGIQQYDVRISEPSFPAIDDTAVIPPRERYVLAHRVSLPRGRVLIFGVEEHLGSTTRLYVSASTRTATGLLRGHNLNAAVGGSRPDASSGNVIEARGDAGLRVRTLTIQAIHTARNRRIDATATYMLSRSTTNTAGAFQVPAAEEDALEWGALAPTHAALTSVTGRWRGLVATLSPRWRSGTPYTVMLPEAGPDGLFNVRPPDVSRNASRTPAQADVGARVAYAFAVNRRRGAAAPAATGDTASSSRDRDVLTAPRGRRIEIHGTVQNLLNRSNYLAVGSVIGSPLFGHPTSAGPARRFEGGVRVQF
jgi:hypothetical protein